MAKQATATAAATAPLPGAAARRIIRISFREQSSHYCALLGAFGFHGAAIAKETGLSISQVYTRLHRAGIKLRDYRDMKSDFATIIVKRSRLEVEKTLRVRLAKLG